MDPHASSLRVAVVGAGLAGLTAARALQDAGLTVQVLDKGRGPGGRLSTRRREDGGSFDHGAQYFTAREPAFVAQVQRWCEEGLAAEWKARIGTLAGGRATLEPHRHPRYVGVPGMSAPAGALAAGLALRSSVRVMDLQREGAGWSLTTADGERLGPFDAVVLALPAPQAAPLLAAAPALAAQAARVPLAPCWSVMAAFEAPLPLQLDGVFFADSALSWAARDSSKPGRAPGERWVLHAGPAWTQAHLEEAPEAVARALLQELQRQVGQGALPACSAVAHRWRYALPTEPLSVRALWDADTRLGACGDWCGGPRVEGAFLSGLAMAEAVCRS